MERSPLCHLPTVCRERQAFRSASTLIRCSASRVRCSSGLVFLIQR